MNNQERQERIIELLKETKRKGIKGLIEYMVREGYFEGPASTKFHGAEPGGLAKHSWNVYNLLLDIHLTKPCLDVSIAPGQKPLPIKTENIVIAALLHDLCKVGAYLPNYQRKTPYKWNKAQPKGHATLSIKRIEQFIKLEPLEKMMIRFHMNIYGLEEFYKKDSWEYKANAEYSLRGDHSKDDQMTPEESKEYRYGNSLRNAWYHNPIVKLMSICDELAVMQDKSESVPAS